MKNNEIYNMNCLEGLKKIPPKSVDCIVTDPPFAFAGSASNGMSSLTSDQFFTHWLKELFTLFLRVSKDESVWFVYSDWKTLYLYEKTLQEIQGYQSGKIKKVSQVLLHDRQMLGMGKPFRNQVEYIAFMKCNKSDVSNIPNTQSNIISSYWYYGKHKHHPAEKDPKIMQKFVEWGSKEGQLVLDPFMGSGTTALACLETNRQYIGFEMEERYFLTAKNRIKDKKEELKQSSLVFS